jgi:dTDP-4-dehydrorhamnose reductase
MAATLAREEPLTLFADEWRTPIYVDDLHAAVKILLRVGSPGIYHAGGPDWLSRVEMGLQMAQVFGLSQQPISPRTRSDAGQSHLRAKDVSLQCSRLLALGWQQTPFLHGLKESLHQWQPTAPS